MRIDVHRMVNHLGGCRVEFQTTIVLQIIARSNGALRKTATAIWADSAEFILYAAHTECALVGTDIRLGGIRRKTGFATFAMWSQG